MSKFDAGTLAFAFLGEESAIVNLERLTSLLEAVYDAGKESIQVTQDSPGVLPIQGTDPRERTVARDSDGAVADIGAGLEPSAPGEKSSKVNPEPGHHPYKADIAGYCMVCGSGTCADEGFRLLREKASRTQTVTSSDWEAAVREALAEFGIRMCHDEDGWFWVKEETTRPVYQDEACEHCGKLFLNDSALTIHERQCVSRQGESECITGGSATSANGITQAPRESAAHVTANGERERLASALQANATHVMELKRRESVIRKAVAQLDANGPIWGAGGIHAILLSALTASDVVEVKEK